MQDCIFCKIVSGEIPCHKIYEDEFSLAFLDINPRAKGHSVVIPKGHAKTPFDMSDGEFAKLFISVKKVQSLIEEKLHPDGFNVGWNQMAAGGQVVDHVHIHILPRWKDDGGGNMHSIVESPGDESVEGVARYFLQGNP